MANTSIKEGGKPRLFAQVKCLMVEGNDGQFYPWYPDSELSTLNVEKNGVYKASEKGVLGWSLVHVNVPTSEGVTGKDPDTGEDVYVHPDPSGELVTDVLPVEIRVIEPPTNPYGTYVDGQAITKDGMVVKAYDSNGNEMQTVPNVEITLNPTTAVFDRYAGRVYGVDDTSILDYPENNPIIATSALGMYDMPIQDSDHGYRFNVTGGGAVYVVHSLVADIGHNLYWLSKSAFQIARGWGDLSKDIPLRNVEQSAQLNDDAVGTFYYLQRGTASEMPPFAATMFAHEPPSVYDMAKQIFGAEGIPGSPQTITVSWPRTGDGAVLETTFDITVGPHGGTGDD